MNLKSSVSLLRSHFGYSLLVLASVLSFSDTSRGQQSGEFSKSDKLAIEQMIESYSQAVQRQDYVKLREYLQPPYVRFPGGIVVYDSMDSAVDYFRKDIEQRVQRGYDHSKYVQTRITVLSPDRALVNKVYRRYKKDGSFLEELATVYLVSKVSGAWKVNGSLAQELKYFGKVY